MMTSWWKIEPRDPLIVRDGKPFGAIPGSRATSLVFPFPSTLAGGVRTRIGTYGDKFNTGLISELKKVAVRSPLLAELSDDGEVENVFVLAPADALIFDSQTKNEISVTRLEPIDVEQGITNLAQAPHDKDALAPVGLAKADARKPSNRAPRFWRWTKFVEWLAAENAGALAAKTLTPNERTFASLAPHELGIPNLPVDARTHVQIKRDTQTAEDGMLFQTRGLEFNLAIGDVRRGDMPTLGEVKQLALVAQVDTSAAALPKEATLDSCSASLGGERRIVLWRESQSAKLNDIAQCPANIVQKISASNACRVVLLTPAHFANGSSPARGDHPLACLLKPQHGVTPQLKATAMPRYQTVSGWDLENRHPKRTRRLVPAGTVFYLALDGTPQAVEAWARAMWFQCVSDNDPQGDAEQTRRDGFGLAVLGAWDNQPKKLQFEV